MYKTILRLPTVIARTGLGRSSIYRKMKDGTFPHSVKISERCVGWTDESIEKLIEERVAASNPTPLAEKRDAREAAASNPADNPICAKTASKPTQLAEKRIDKAGAKRIEERVAASKTPGTKHKGAK